jgi:pilus assembly protein TadC
MVVLLSILLGGGIFLILKGFIKEERISILERLEVSPAIKVRKNSFLSWIGFFFYPLNTFILNILRLKIPIKRKLNFINSSLTPQDFLFLKEMGALLGALGGWLLSDSLLVLGVLSFVGFLLPDLWLLSKSNKIKFEILKYLPETVDLLGLCIEAGLDFVSSIRWILSKTKMNPFLAHLKITMNEIIVGKSREEALTSLAQRVNMPEVRSFANTLIQAERMGTPIREAFDIISEDTRERRIQIGEKQALRAPILIVFPLILILIVVVIIVAGPIIIKFLQGGFFNI